MRSIEKMCLAIVAVALGLSVLPASSQQRTYQRDKYGAKEHSKGYYETDSGGPHRQGRQVRSEAVERRLIPDG